LGNDPARKFASVANFVRRISIFPAPDAFSVSVTL